jgi:hypothetical protein
MEHLMFLVNVKVRKLIILLLAEEEVVVVVILEGNPVLVVVVVAGYLPGFLIQVLQLML